MSLIALPAGLCPNAFSMWQETNQLAFAAPRGGSEQVVDQGSDRWMISMSLANRLFSDAARVEAFIASLRGMTNTVALYHWIRKVPRGTMRGAPVLAAPMFVRDPNLPITAAPGVTLLAGDMIGCGGQLFQVRDDVTATSGGFMNVAVVNRSRINAAAGAAITWDRPTAPFRLTSKSALQYIPGYSPSVSLDFAEAVG